MYKVCGNMNYECTCTEEQVFGSNLGIDEALSLFLKLVNNKESLNFTEMDTLIDALAEENAWDEEDYFFGSYGGAIAVYEQAIAPNNFDREVVMVIVERDPINKKNEYSDIIFGAEITCEEKERFSSLK